jgi:NAD+ diphosphatase
MPIPDPSIGFTFNPLNRRAEKRDSDDYIEQLRSSPATRFLVFERDVPVLKRENGNDPLFTATETAALGAPAQCVFLGEASDGSARFALGFDQGVTESLAAGCALVDLRSIAVQELVAAELLGPLGQAKSMLDWHRRHRFCANCGELSKVTSAGWRRLCDACGAQHFPRVDPVVIMLVIDGERCLLGRQRHFAPRMYSALAGFVEPGETAEDAVRREVLEEAGIHCAKVAYFASQPWPFPSSLMIGCFAQAEGTSIVIDQNELEDARWFAREEVAGMLAGSHAEALTAPKGFAIAHHLLRDYVARGAGVIGG